MTDFYQVRMAFRTQSHVLGLDFTDPIKARAAFEMLQAPTGEPLMNNRVVVSDDAGTRVEVDRSDILFVMLDDRKKGELMKRGQAVAAQVEQIRGQTALATSSEIKAAVSAAELAGLRFGPQGPQMNGPGRH